MSTPNIATAPTVEQIANVLSESLGETSDYQVAVKLHGMFAEAGVPRFNGRSLRELAHLAADLEEMVAFREERENINAREVTRLNGVLAEQQTRLEALRKAEGYANPRRSLSFALAPSPEQLRGRALIEAAEWVVGDAVKAESPGAES